MTNKLEGEGGMVLWEDKGIERQIISFFEKSLFQLEWFSITGMKMNSWKGHLRYRKLTWTI